MERLGDLRFNEAEDRWELFRVCKGWKDDDQSSVFVPSTTCSTLSCDPQVEADRARDSRLEAAECAVERTGGPRCPGEVVGEAGVGRVVGLWRRERGKQVGAS